jgi:DNA excision repair protein ERCC-2
MPQWISQFLTEVSLNLSTDMAVNLARSFLKEMAQPTSKEEEIGKSLWTLEHILQQPPSRPPTTTNGDLQPMEG